MFDFSKFTDLVTGFAQSALSEAPAVPQELLGVLEANGIDPQIIAGLGPEEIASTLAELGLDPAEFVPADLQQLATGLTDLTSLTSEN